MMHHAITAITLSRTGITRYTPRDMQHYVHRRTIETVEDLHTQRLAALYSVKTPWCFFLDDDDALPPNVGGVLHLCLAAAEQHGAKMVSTDEMIIAEQETKRNDMIHHLVLMHTDTAQQAARDIPLGRYWTESILYPQLAQAGHLHVAEVGYHWHCGNSGFHTNPYLVEARINSNRWCSTQRLKLIIH